MKYLLLSFCILAISLTLLLFFVFLKDNFLNSNQILTITSSDISLKVGDKVSNFYNVSDENAEVQISAQDESVFIVENDQLLAIKPGSTIITIVANLNGDKANTSFLLTVERDGYSYNITPIQNCTINENNVTLTDHACQISVVVYDKLDNVYFPENLTCSASNNAIIIKEIDSFILVSSEDCKVTISYPDISFEIVLNVVVE